MKFLVFSLFYLLLNLSFIYCWHGGFGNFSIDVDETKSSYVISINNKPWLTSGPTAIHCNDNWYLSSDNLKLIATSSTNENDKKFGRYKTFTYHWLADNTPFLTTFFSYSEYPMVIFEQYFPFGVNGTSSHSPNTVVASFPTFNPSASLHYLTYQGLWDTGSQGDSNGKTLNKFKGGLDGGVPILFLDENATNTIVLSPFSNFPVGYHCQPSNLNSLACGITGMVESIPLGFRHREILFVGTRPTFALYDWGTILLTEYEKQRSGPDVDLPTKYLGYWTDNGAYYYYQTEVGKNYEDTILDVLAYHQSLKLPVKYYQLDSWWYFKGAHDGVKLWDSQPSIFPHGMKALQQKLGLPVVLHNRYWSPDNEYKSNFTFIVESIEALPTQASFWEYLLDRAQKEYGCIVYEQDWLIDQFNNMNATQTSVHLARNWLRQMGRSASKRQMTIQYCMPLWSDYLESVEIPSVTQIRVSNDYNPERKQWNIGGSSLMAWSLGLIPFKDTFWTSHLEPGNPWNKTEPNPALQTLISVLSGGLVGFGDGIGFTNTTLLMKTCNLAGLLLKPSKPATSIDRTFTKYAPQGEVYNSYSNISGLHWNYVISADLAAPYQVYPDDLPFLQSYGRNTWKFISWTDPTNIYTFAQQNPIQLLNHPDDYKAGKWPFDYYVVIPVLTNDFVLIGEVDKFVTMSPQRFSNLQVSDSQIAVDVAGVAGEAVTIYVSHVGCISTILCPTCSFPITTTMTLVCKYNGVLDCDCQ